MPALLAAAPGTCPGTGGSTPHRQEETRVPDGLRLLADLGYRLVLVTNQSGVARGYFSEADVETFHNALLRELAAHGVKLDALYTCPFHPTEGVGPYRRESPLRKPAPGMLLQAAAWLSSSSLRQDSP